MADMQKPPKVLKPYVVVDKQVNDHSYLVVYFVADDKRMDQVFHPKFRDYADKDEEDSKHGMYCYIVRPNYEYKDVVRFAEELGRYCSSLTIE